MSVVDDYLPVFIAGFIAVIGSFMIMIYKKKDDIFDKTRHQSTLTTINVGNIQEQMREIKKMNDDLKEHFDKRLDRIEETNKEELRRAFEKIDKNSTEGYNLRWRVGELEARFRGRSNGGSGSGSVM